MATALTAAAPICRAAFVSGFRPEPEVTVSQWADAHRIVGKPSPEPGPWRTERVPYTREIMDNLSPSSDVEMTVLMKAAQGAGTEILLNALGCWIHRYPDSAMLVLPTVNTAKKFVRLRLDKLIEINPALRAAVSEPRSRSGSNTSSVKEFGADALVIVGANSGNDLRSYPCRYLEMDEVDGYPADVDGEGDPTELAIQRTAGYRNRKIFMLSTPTVEDISLIVRWHRRGDQRLYYVPCPFCGHEQALVWSAPEGKPGGLRWPHGEPNKARYQCEHCGDQFEEWRKIDLLSRGAWVPQAPGVGAGKIRSYQINALYYPYGWPGNSWANLAAQFEAEHKDPIKLKTFINLKLGQPWKDKSEAKADAGELLARCESYGPTIPAAAAVLTAGADVQANRIEVELVAWGKDEESWSVEHKVFLGDTSKLVSNDPQRPSPWEDLDKWLAGEWLSELNVPLSISAMCVDAGYQTHTVAKWCGERFSRRVWATVGRTGPKPIWPKKPSRTAGNKHPLFVIGVDSAKENIYARLRILDPGPGFMHFAKGTPLQFFEQLTAEVRIPDYTGPIPKFVWRKKTPGARNEILDCRGEAYAALCGLTAGALRLNREVDALRKLADSKVAAAKGEYVPPPAGTQRQVIRSSWMG